MAKIEVDFGKAAGRIRPLHGLCNGPVAFGALMDVSHRYRELSVPWVRLHDTNWPHPREVDVPQIFPDFDANPDDPASYCFGPTDDYLRSILATGARIVYRLGVSIEHYPRKRYVFAPPDFDKWARVALGIARHYTEGWADGIENAVEYWEIWNEPELGDRMWSGTFEEYLDLYRAAATTFKRHNPNLKVGGFAATCAESPQVEQFLAYCREHDVPLDFYSWHYYASHPDRFVRGAAAVQRLLEKYGFGSIPTFLDEWNYLAVPWSRLWAEGEFLRRDAFERMKNEEGAAFAAATLIRMQDAPVDIMNYYDGQPMTWFCGLFDYYGAPQRTFYAFKAFNELLACPERVAASCDVPDLDVLAGRSSDGETGAALIANFGAHEGKITISLQGVPPENAQPEILMVDRDRGLEQVLSVNAAATASGTANEPKANQPPAEIAGNSLDLFIRRHAVCLIRFSGIAPKAP